MRKQTMAPWSSATQVRSELHPQAGLPCHSFIQTLACSRILCIRHISGIGSLTAMTPTCKTVNWKNKYAASSSLGKEDTISLRICQMKQSEKNKINNFWGPSEKQKVFLLQASSKPLFSYWLLEPGLMVALAFCSADWICSTVVSDVLSFLWMSVHICVAPCPLPLHRKQFFKFFDN